MHGGSITSPAKNREGRWSLPPPTLSAPRAQLNLEKETPKAREPHSSLAIRNMDLMPGSVNPLYYQANKRTSIMTQRLVFIPDQSYTNQTALNAQLTSLHNANPISILSTHGNTMPDQWARSWALANGVPWYNHGVILDGAGIFEPAPRTLSHVNLTNPDQILTAGSGANPTAAAAIATVKGKNITKI
jgi:hypothetical protein